MITIQRRVRLPIDIGSDIKVMLIRHNQKSDKVVMRDYIVANLLKVCQVEDKNIDLEGGALCQMVIPTVINDRLRTNADKMGITIEQYTVRLIKANLKIKS